MMRIIALLALSLCGLCPLSTAFDPELETSLMKKYGDTVLLLRHPVHSDGMEFNAAGELLTKAPEGSWTVDSPVEITKFKLGPDKLTLECTRYLLGFENSGNELRSFRVTSTSHRKARIEIALNRPLSSMEEADAILDRIFAANERELVNTLPEYWRPFFDHRYGTGAKSNPRSADPATTPNPKGLSEDGKPVEMAPLDFKRVNPPKAVFTPEPSYEADAKEMRFQGVVVVRATVDETGKVKRVQIVRPLGMGLDEKAIKAVETWKFDPATRDGIPVAVEIGVEISFSLY